MREATREVLGGLATPLAYKVLLDRYTIKDLEHRFEVGDVALVVLKDDPKFVQKGIGRVKTLHDDGTMTVHLPPELNPDATVEEIRVSKDSADRPLETTWDQVVGRVAHAVAEVEPSKKLAGEWGAKFERALAEQRLIPAGRVLAGAGSGVGLTWFNCYVIESPHDSRGGIVKTLGQMVEIMSRGGGVGFDVSTLRPRRAIVRGVNGRSSGAVSWMDLYSRAIGLIEQGGSRRGAGMIMLHDWHPDLLRFIDAKRNPGMIENANISVLVSDEFMEAVKQGEEWVLRFPDTDYAHYDAEWDGDLEAWESKGYPVIEYARMPARDIWNRLTESAWASAEPGMVFASRFQSDSNSQLFSRLVATNPCVTGDTLVSTTSGLLPIRELLDGPSLVATDARVGGGYVPASAAFTTGVKPVFRLTTKEGFRLRLTDNHRLMTRRGWVEAKDLQAGDKIFVHSGSGAFGDQGSYDLGLTLGWLVGDGTVKSDSATLSFFGEEKQEIAPVLLEAVNSVVRTSKNGRDYHLSVLSIGKRDEARIDSTRLRELAVIHGLTETKLHVPDVIFRGTRDTQVGFLRALFSADGHVELAKGSRKAAVLTSVSTELLRGIQALLLNFGIYSRIYLNRHNERTHLLPDGHGGKKSYRSQASHDLRITRASLARFAEEIGFLHARKQEALQKAAAWTRGPYREDFVATFEALIPGGTEVVYDLTVPSVHAFTANGLVVHNCGEQPLPAWGVCTLGHVNLAACLGDGEIDHGLLRDTVRTGVRLLDDVVDGTPYFFAENEAHQKRERRIGLGTMGLGEVLMRLGLRYGSPEAVAYTENLYREIAVAAYEASIDLAAEKGAFPAWDPAVLGTDAFVARMARQFPRLDAGLREHGMRNVTVLTQAPTGTTGSMIDTSTGIEPYYALQYQRKSRLGLSTVRVRPVQEWLAEHLYPDDVKLDSIALPEHFVGAMDLSPQEHVHMQAPAQRWTDSSISKTANAPEDFTVEQTRELYMLAYDLGCKGVTIYRDNSRDQQVLHTTKSGKDEPAKTAPQGGPTLAPRPNRMRGECFLVRTHFGNLTVDVHEEPTTGEPVEIIASAGAAGSDLMADAVALGMSASVLLRLRSDVPVLERLEVIADKFRNIGGSKSGNGGLGAAASLAQGIARGLDQYLDVVRQRSGGSGAAVPAAKAVPVTTGPEGHPPVQGTSATVDLCPSCGRYSMEMVEGCRTCRDCGFSRCS